MLLPNVYSLGYNTGQNIQRLLSNHTIPDLPPAREILESVTRIPSLYKEWWLNLVTNDPIHVFIETTLILSIVYIVVSQSKEWGGEKQGEHLTEAEKEELLLEWKTRGRKGLVPQEDSSRDDLPPLGSNVIVHALNGRTMTIQNNRDVSSNSNSSSSPSKKRTVLNFATHDFLGMSCTSVSSEEEGPGKPVKKASQEALSRYGCGSCGPRGFYGTIDVHLQLEDKISKFTNTEGAIMYSDGASTVTSTIAAFAKRGDLLVVDEGVNEPIVTGVALSRANVKWFRHNDMDDLRRVLERVKVTDKKLGRKPNDQRRFIVVEGLYKNLGTIVPLDELVALKNEFHYRLILDESFSFGTLGPTGRGVIDLYDKRHMYDAEIVTISLENALGSIGGVTVGNEEVVDHQRLSGAGYCFSASSPPFTASAAMAALEQIQNCPELLEQLNANKQYFYEKLTSMIGGFRHETLFLVSDERSPIVMLEVADDEDENVDYNKHADLLDAIVRECLKGGVAMVSTGRHVAGNMHTVPPPAIRMTVSAVHTRIDIDKATSVLKKAIISVIPK